MMSRSSLTTLLLATSVALGGCGILKKKTDAAPSATVATTATAPVVAPPIAAPPAETAPVAVAAPAIDEATVPAPQDFEDEAFEKVTTANFKTELTRLTKEISAK